MVLLEPAATAATPFSQRVQHCFGRSAAAYCAHARLQAAVAERLARLLRIHASALPAGARADLGAGSGLLARAIERHLGGAPLLRLDSCQDLLLQDAREPTAPPQRLWDLNQGLPPELQGAALLGSSFALQWLEQPQRALQLWCEALAPGGVLALAVPCAGSFGLWHQACQRAGVPFTGLQLPQADALISLAGSRLRLRRAERLQFSRPNRGALAFLRQFKAIGAQASRGPRLSRGQLRRLEQHWPAEAAHVGWEVLVIVGQSAP